MPKQPLAESDPQIAKLIREETRRQAEGLELIASENFVSPAVLEALGSTLTNKYAEGYPGKRYYGGCEVVDQVEQLAIDRAKQIFAAEHANVQPHSGSQANMAAYFALAAPGDTLLAMSLNFGGHLTHGSPVNFSGKLFKIVPYGLAKDTETIDLAEVRRLTARWQAGSETGSLLPQVWMRLLPGVAVQTHHSHTQTGQHDSKFGMTPGELLQAVQLCRANKIAVKGLHFHQGSQFRDPEPLGDGLDRALDLASEVGFLDGWHLCPGGGWGVAYHEDDLPDPSIEMYVRFISTNLLEGCRKRGLALPHLHLEPGRSLVARAGVALYRAGTVKETSSQRWVLVDGGLADNPRHALYGARYSCLTVTQPLAPAAGRVSIAGPYCESGDVLIEDIQLRAVSEGELIAVPVSGAYHLSMSSNYNGARRPAVLLIENGQARLIQVRETVTDLTHRDTN